MYSQNNEEIYISQHFSNLEKAGVPLKRTFLDLGAYDGIDLSNTRALMESGWAGVCVEPHPQIFQRLKHNCEPFKEVHSLECAIGDKNGIEVLLGNEEYYSSLIEKETKRWETINIKFAPINVTVYDFATFLKEQSPIKSFDFVSIDCEGMDLNILTQINLDEIGCYLVCVETNGIDTEKYIHYINQFKNFRVLTINAENLIMGRNEL